MYHRHALSLVEVMAASTILVIGLGSAFSAMGSSDQTRRRTEDRNHAMVEIQSQIEKLQAMDSVALAAQFASSPTYTFAVTGLTPPVSVGRTAAGLVEKLAPTSTAYGCTVLRVRCDWEEVGGADAVQMIYFYTRRTYGG